jgi:hypothetical protein
MSVERSEPVPPVEPIGELTTAPIEDQNDDEYENDYLPPLRSYVAR